MTGLRLGTLLFALAFVAPRPALAQVWTIGEYLGLRAEMSRLDAATGAHEPGTDGHRAATVALAHQVTAVVGYLNGWLVSGTMAEDLVPEAEAQRYVLFENLVQLQAEVGDCIGSRTALEAMRVAPAPEAAPPGLLESAEQWVAGCVQRPWRTPPPPAAASPSPAPARAVWASGLGLAAVGGVVAWAGGDDRASYRRLGESLRNSPSVDLAARRQQLDDDIRSNRRAATALVSLGAVAVGAGVAAELALRERASVGVRVRADGSEAVLTLR